MYLLFALGMMFAPHAASLDGFLALPYEDSTFVIKVVSIKYAEVSRKHKDDRPQLFSLYNSFMSFIYPWTLSLDTLGLEFLRQMNFGVTAEKNSHNVRQFAGIRNGSEAHDDSLSRPRN
jgi:hypothetical protein